MLGCHVLQVWHNAISWEQPGWGLSGFGMSTASTWVGVVKRYWQFLSRLQKTPAICQQMKSWCLSNTIFKGCWNWEVSAIRARWGGTKALCCNTDCQTMEHAVLNHPSHGAKPQGALKVELTGGGAGRSTADAARMRHSSLRTTLLLKINSFQQTLTEASGPHNPWEEEGVGSFN